VLGICRGIQLLNVARGGTLWQDLPSQLDGPTRHRHHETYDRNLHEVDLLPGTWIGDLYEVGAEPERVTVNSVHHQAVRELGDGLVVEAVSAHDGIVEAVRLDDPDRWVRGVQWHPEFSDPADPGLLDRRPLMGAFLDACRARRAM
jgi:putative glutamine amidotransferase